MANLRIRGLAEQALVELKTRAASEQVIVNTLVLRLIDHGRPAEKPLRLKSASAIRPPTAPLSSIPGHRPLGGH